jgi:phosphoribosyl-ATP pyrophosphohydrolase
VNCCVDVAGLDCQIQAENIIPLLKLARFGNLAKLEKRSHKHSHDNLVFKGRNMSIQWLFDVIQSRKENPSEGSYTSSLFAEGLPKIAQKVGEEGTEVVVAALAQDNQRLIEEVADLTYHTLVLLAARGLTIEDILTELEKRHKS